MKKTNDLVLDAKVPANLNNSPTYYLSVVSNKFNTDYDVTKTWGAKDVATPKTSGYRALILNRKDPGSTPHLDKTYSHEVSPVTMLQDIKNTMGANEDDCILIVFVNFIGIGAWEQDFIDEFEGYGAGSTYRGLCQNALLLSGSNAITSRSVNYIMANIPIEGRKGYEIGSLNTEMISMAFELIPINLPSGTTYTLSIVGGNNE